MLYLKAELPEGLILNQDFHGYKLSCTFLLAPPQHVQVEPVRYTDGASSSATSRTELFSSARELKGRLPVSPNTLY